MSRWFRFYDDVINDPKILRLSDANFRAWVTLLCIASKHDGELPSTADIALVLRMKPAKVAEWLAVLAAAGLVDNDEGHFSPHNWNARQFKSDKDPTATDRKRRQRERDKDRDEINVTRDVTDESLSPETEQIQITEQTSSLRSEAAPATRPKTPRAKAKHPLPDLWQLDEQDFTHAREAGFATEKIREMAAAFLNHHRAKGSLMADWHAAWRTWCGNEIKFHSSQGAKSNGRRTVHDAAKDLTRTLERLAEFDEPAPGGVCLEESGNAFRLLPPR